MHIGTHVRGNKYIIHVCVHVYVCVRVCVHVWVYVCVPVESFMHMQYMRSTCVCACAKLMNFGDCYGTGNVTLVKSYLVVGVFSDAQLIDGGRNGNPSQES